MDYKIIKLTDDQALVLGRYADLATARAQFTDLATAHGKRAVTLSGLSFTLTNGTRYIVMGAETKGLQQPVNLKERGTKC